MEEVENKKKEQERKEWMMEGDSKRLCNQGKRWEKRERREGEREREE